MPILLRRSLLRRSLLLTFAWLLTLQMPLSAARGTLDMGGATCTGAPTDCSGTTPGIETCAGLALKGLNLNFINADSKVATSAFRHLDSSKVLSDLLRGQAWLTSGAWASPSELILVDRSRSSLFLYNIPEGFLRRLQIPGRPIRVQNSPTGTWIEIAGGKLLRLHEENRPAVSAMTSFMAYTPPLPTSASSLLTWSVLGQQLIAFGDFMQRDGEWATGLLVNDLRLNNSVLLYKQSIGSRFRRYYLVGNAYVAVAANKAFFLKLSEHPSLVEVQLRGEPRALRTIPLSAQGVSFAPLPPRSGAASAEGVYAALEQSTMPAGIYGQGDLLYLLDRRPGKRSTTNWYLTIFDAKQVKPLRRVELPTSANHLTIIPGSPSWAFVEKARVEALGEQRIGSLFFIPARDLGKDSLTKPSKSYTLRREAGESLLHVSWPQETR